MYRCIMIHKWQYIDKSKLCITASLRPTIYVHMHTYVYAHMQAGATEIFVLWKSWPKETCQWVTSKDICTKLRRYSYI